MKKLKQVLALLFFMSLFAVILSKIEWRLPQILQFLKAKLIRAQGDIELKTHKKPKKFLTHPLPALDLEPRLTEVKLSPWTYFLDKNQIPIPSVPTPKPVRLLPVHINAHLLKTAEIRSIIEKKRAIRTEAKLDKIRRHHSTEHSVKRAIPRYHSM